MLLTDAVNGRTRVWKAPQTTSYIGNEKAIGIVQGERLGVNFGSNGSAGAFKAIEPRQVFPGGRLRFLISVVPQSANRVTLNVIVDAQRQTVVKVFPTTDAGDHDLVSYLSSGRADDQYDFTGSTSGTGDPNSTNLG
jgi:hypothetical protein